MDLAIIAQGTINGIFMGGILAFIALGLALIWGVMGVLNIAHSHFVMLALFASYAFVRYLGFHPYLTLPFVLVLFGLLGAAVYVLLIKTTMKVSVLLALLVTIALMMFLEGVMTVVQSKVIHLSYLAVDPKYWIGTVEFAGVFIDIPAAIAFGASIGMAFLLFWFIRKTDIGRNIRACSENPIVSSLMSINVGRTQLIGFCLGIMCTAAAAVLMLPTIAFDSTVGHNFMLTVFTIVVLAGFGSFLGTLIAGIIVGFAEGLAGVFIPGTLTPAVSLSILVVVLLFRPQGLFGEK